MQDYDFELSNDNLINSIKKDLLKRNIKINVLIDLLSNINKSTIIAIDGDWGSGKTVFLKQIETINKFDINDAPNMNSNIISKFKNDFAVFYYNAWQNDYHDSAVLSLIYNLINDNPKVSNCVASGKVELPIDVKEAIKAISKNAINPDKVQSFKDITNSIYSVEKTKNALNNLFEYLELKEKKILFIIDELDRCRPSFAIDLLETIKHYYNNEKLMFLVGTNNEQLSHTVSNYYGLNFDGYGYLNRFYDYIIPIDEITPTQYLDKVLGLYNHGDYKNASLFAVCNHFSFQMRQINRLINDYNLLTNYFSVYRSGFYVENDIVKFIFLPFCLGLKIKNRSLLNSFLHGKGYEELEKFINSDSSLFSIIEHNYYNDCQNNKKESYTKGDILQYLKDNYSNLFNNDDENNILKIKFLNIFSLLDEIIVRGGNN